MIDTREWNGKCSQCGIPVDTEYRPTNDPDPVLCAYCQPDELSELRADRDRLAAEVERLRENEENAASLLHDAEAENIALRERLRVPGARVVSCPCALVPGTPVAECEDGDE